MPRRCPASPRALHSLGAGPAGDIVSRASAVGGRRALIPRAPGPFSSTALLRSGLWSAPRCASPWLPLWSAISSCHRCTLRRAWPWLDPGRCIERGFFRRRSYLRRPWPFEVSSMGFLSTHSTNSVVDPVSAAKHQQRGCRHVDTLICACNVHAHTCKYMSIPSMHSCVSKCTHTHMQATGACMLGFLLIQRC